MTSVSQGAPLDRTVLQMTGIVKEFPGVRALKGVDLDVREGEVHALVGENGAGKSTLIKILAGIYRPDAGQVRVFGRDAVLANPQVAQKLGIAVIHQELNLVPLVTVAENIAICRTAQRPLYRLMNWAETRRRAADILGRLGAVISPNALVADLTVGEQQMVEIAKALAQNARIVIMDEPTAALSDTESERLFRVVRQLRSGGVSVIYISHKLDEVLNLADRISVLRDGELIKTVEAGETDREHLIAMMVGRPLGNMYPKEPVAAGSVLLELVELAGPGHAPVSFTLRAGEVVGVAGLMGAGQTHVAKTIFGLETARSGAMRVKGRTVRFRSPWEAVRAGIALVPEDRKVEGLVLGMPVTENTTLASLDRHARAGLMVRAGEQRTAEHFRSEFDIKCSSLRQEVRFLSGGNQQKVVLGKWLATGPDILILCEPTRGIDVGAKVEIYRLIQRLAEQGKGILLISSDLPELLGMSDRILVMHEGRLTGEVERAEATQESVMRLAVGGERR